MKKLPFYCAVLALAGMASAKADPFNVSTFNFEPGEGWEMLPSTSSMRAAELKFDAPSAEAEQDPVAVFYYFGPGQGGGIDANIERWKGQFQGGPSDEQIVDLPNGTKLLILSGTFMETMGGPFSGNSTPREGYRMLAAILPSDQGAVFIKLTAPEAVADEARAPFEELVRSALE